MVKSTEQVRDAIVTEIDIERIASKTPQQGQDIPVVESKEYAEAGDEVYRRFSPRRKIVITCVLAWGGFLSPIASTTVLSAVPEVASTYNTTGSIINLSNALYQIFMGLCPLLWGPMGQVYGRRWTCIICSFLFFVFSAGTAVAPDLSSFFLLRVLTAFQGTAFLIIGASCIGDIYRPVERATALGFFLSGTLIGPAFGPFLAGIIVTFRSWRDIFWLQAALGGVETVLVIFLLPETIHRKRSQDLANLSKKEYAATLWKWTNPSRIVRLYRYPNLVIAALASSALVFNMYSLLTPIRYVLDPRFHLDTPLQSGLFYMAPGCGYLLGTFVGGRWADHVVKKYIRKRGERIPEDRLRAPLISLGVVIPGSILVYGWSVEKEVGGVPLPVIAMFTQGVAQLFCFTALNTYCLDVMQKRSSEVIAGNYVIRYFFGAVGSAIVLPAIDKVGVGWFSTISALFLVLSTILLYLDALHGRSWRETIDKKKAAKLASRHEKTKSGHSNSTNVMTSDIRTKVERT